jgi:peptide deformylase
MLRPICNSQEKKRRTLNPRICQKTQKENNSGVETCLITTSIHDFLTRAQCGVSKYKSHTKANCGQRGLKWNLWWDGTA